MWCKLEGEDRPLPLDKIRDDQYGLITELEFIGGNVAQQEKIKNFLKTFKWARLKALQKLTFRQLDVTDLRIGNAITDKDTVTFPHLKELSFVQSKITIAVVKAFMDAAEQGQEKGAYLDCVDLSDSEFIRHDKEVEADFKEVEADFKEDTKDFVRRIKSDNLDHVSTSSLSEKFDINLPKPIQDSELVGEFDLLGSLSGKPQYDKIFESLTDAESNSVTGSNDLSLEELLGIDSDDGVGDIGDEQAPMPRVEQPIPIAQPKKTPASIIDQKGAINASNDKARPGVRPASRLAGSANNSSSTSRRSKVSPQDLTRPIERREDVEPYRVSRPRVSAAGSRPMNYPNHPVKKGNSSSDSDLDSPRSISEMGNSTRAALSKLREYPATATNTRHDKRRVPSPNNNATVTVPSAKPARTIKDVLHDVKNAVQVWNYPVTHEPKIISPKHGAPFVAFGSAAEKLLDVDLESVTIYQNLVDANVDLAEKAKVVLGSLGLPPDDVNDLPESLQIEGAAEDLADEIQRQFEEMRASSRPIFG